MQVRWIALLALVHTSVGSISPVATLSSVATTSTVGRLKEAYSRNATARDGRRRSRKKSRSTSSSSGERFSGESVDSLGIEESSSESSSSEEKPTWSKIPGEGWRKWHRTCTPCPEEMVKKWRDPTIKWICGGYQRARRSFKSECMMHYRNCQDGTILNIIGDTFKWICGGYQCARRSFKSECMMHYRNYQDGTAMFVKLHDHRCDDKAPAWNHGRHFFYDYAVKLIDDSSDSKDTSESESESSSSY